MRKTTVNEEEISEIIDLARQGKTSTEIRIIKGVPTSVVRRVCRHRGVELLPGKKRHDERPPRVDYEALAVERESKREAVARGNVHPLDVLREDHPADLVFAVEALKWAGRHSYIRSAGVAHDCIDGKYATPRMKLVEANRVLKREGRPQIGRNEHWV